jgi:hypothetical protein
MKKYLICSVAVLMALVCNKSQNNAQSEEAIVTHKQATLKNKMQQGNSKPVDLEGQLITSLNDSLGSFISDGKIFNFEKMSYGAGYSKKYYRKTKTTHATVIFYHDRKKELKDGINSKDFNDAYARSKSGINNTYQGKNKKDTKILFQGIPFRRYQFVGKYQENNPEGAEILFLTIYKGTFLKIRFSYLVENSAEAKYVDEFMNALVRDLKK